MINAVFREPVHQVLEKIKNESFFKWPNKMAGDSMKRNHVCIVNTTRTTDILQKTVRTLGTT